jgi:hypothetical protein
VADLDRGPAEPGVGEERQRHLHVRHADEREEIDRHDGEDRRVDERAPQRAPLRYGNLLAGQPHAGLRHEKQDAEKIGEGEECCGERRRVRVQVTDRAAEDGAAERHEPVADLPELLRDCGAIGTSRHVGDRGLARGYVQAGGGIRDAREEEQRQPRVLRGDREDHHGDAVAEEAREDDRPPAVAVGEPSEDRRRDRLGERERAEQEADHRRRSAHRLHVERQERDDDPEADHVEEDGDEDEEEDAGLHRATAGVACPRRSRDGAARA